MDAPPKSPTAAGQNPPPADDPAGPRAVPARSAPPGPRPPNNLESLPNPPAASRDGSRSEPVRQPPPIADYELLRRIGSGSYGDAWLARNVLGQFRAVKIVYRSRFSDPRPFEREFEGIQHFEPISRSHPSQLHILHVGKNDAEGCFYYVMELADDAHAPVGDEVTSLTLDDGKNARPHPDPLPQEREQPPDAHREPGTPRPVTALTTFLPLLGAVDEVSAKSKLSLGRGEGGSISQAVSLRSSLATPINPETYAPKTLRSLLLPPAHFPTSSPALPGRLPIPDCVQIGLSLTTALAHLHEQELVHRDIKPSNVIFVNGVAKLGDIGLVTDAGDTQSIVGTEGYLPPEGPGTPQADLYSLGKVLYEISTGMDRRRFAELPEDVWQWSEV